MNESSDAKADSYPSLLIENWLPIQELGIESVRESAPIPGQFPKLKTIHVWWARAPLAAANGVVLAALMPSWSDELVNEIEGLEAALRRAYAGRPDLQLHGKPLENDELYRVWMLWLTGVRGDAVGTKHRLDVARAEGKQIPNPHSYPPAFKNRINAEDLEVLHRLLEHTWGRVPHVLDPTAGGGSLPFSSLRLGLNTTANDLNSVAVGILHAGLKSAVDFGSELQQAISQFGLRLVQRCEGKLDEFFGSDAEGERISAYLFARTVRCPRTGGPVPLAPNWWLDKAGQGVAAQPIASWGSDGEPSAVEFEILAGPTFGDFDPDAGSVAGGSAISIWDGLVVDGDYIKSEAQAGRMGSTLYAVACRKAKTTGRGFTRYFRAPSAADYAKISAASAYLNVHREAWIRDGILPSQEVPEGSKTSELLRYGMTNWTDLYTERQLVVHGTFVEEWRRLREEVIQELGAPRGNAVMLVLAMMQGKALTFNSRLTTWVPARTMLNNAFDRHDFAFKWTHGEFDAASELFQWAHKQVVDAFGGIADLIALPETGGNPLDYAAGSQAREVAFQVLNSSATSLDSLSSNSIEFVNIDPPYYDNVQYAELADFFYVWEKATIGQVLPVAFAGDATNKENEATANEARFASQGRRKRELAAFDYQQKMSAIFAECYRVLRPDGIMVVWFTHKKAEAWDTLATAMIEAGFVIEASWPVSTQSATALNHAKKNSARSTIMLVCRKRSRATSEPVFFDDIEVEVRTAARNAVRNFQAEVGIGGVDLQLATYGPTLSVISRHWPVLSSEPDEAGRSRRLRPEEALDVARQEVARLRMQRLVGKDASFDAATDFWLMCWETFQAREFPFDEARKLALGVGYDVDEAIKSGLLGKKAGNVELASPVARGRSLRKAMDDTGRLPRLVDALHLMLVTYRDDKLAAARTWLADSGYGEEQQFLDVVQAAVNAVPRVRGKKGLTVEEAILLEDAVVGLFGDEITIPVEAEEQVAAAQMTLEG